MLLVTGGISVGSSLPLDSTEIYDPDIGSWKAGAALPVPRSNLAAATIVNRILIFG